MLSENKPDIHLKCIQFNCLKLYLFSKMHLFYSFYPGKALMSLKIQLRA